jgi:hypothetical protein
MGRRPVLQAAVAAAIAVLALTAAATTSAKPGAASSCTWLQEGAADGPVAVFHSRFFCKAAFANRRRFFPGLRPRLVRGVVAPTLIPKGLAQELCRAHLKGSGVVGHVYGRGDVRTQNCSRHLWNARWRVTKVAPPPSFKGSFHGDATTGEIMLGPFWVDRTTPFIATLFNDPAHPEGCPSMTFEGYDSENSETLHACFGQPDVMSWHLTVPSGDESGRLFTLHVIHPTYSWEIVVG